MRLRWVPWLLSVGVALALCTVGCGSRDGGVGMAGPLADRPLAAFRIELLELAFDAATAIPLDPHIKDRARAQQAVVEVCLELDQPHRALKCIERIPNWRRGLGYAELALYWAKKGQIDEVPELLKRAEKESEGPVGQAWRRDRIRVKIAQTHAFLGRTEEAARFGANVDPSEDGKVLGARASGCSDEDFDAMMRVLDDLLASQHFDVLRNAFASAAQLYGRFYDQTERRAAVEEKVKASVEKLKLPVLVVIDVLTGMAEVALEHGDRHKALETLRQTQTIVDGVQWNAEYGVPVMAKMAGLYFRAGDEVRARKTLNAALAFYEANRQGVTNIYRAETLQPLAEAYQTMGDTAAALKVYTQAVEEGVENPNSRPRAQDLSATCASMARCGVEPGPELWRRIHQIRQGLGPPW